MTNEQKDRERPAEALQRRQEAQVPRAGKVENLSTVTAAPQEASPALLERARVRQAEEEAKS